MSEDAVASEGAGSPASEPQEEEEILAALRGVIDPEVGLDVVTMGLIYGVEVEGHAVRVRYTLTTRGCPMEAVITNGITSLVRRVPGVEKVEAELVWEPRWHPGMIEDDAL